MLGPGLVGRKGGRLVLARSSGVIITGVEQTVDDVISPDDNEDCPEFCPELHTGNATAVCR